MEQFSTELVAVCLSMINYDDYDITAQNPISATQVKYRIIYSEFTHCDY